MAIAKTRIHMICGLCGNNEMFKFKIDPKGREDKDGNQHPAVFITCGNCSTLTSLDEVIKEEEKKIMETYQNYKGYGITYYTINRTTQIDQFGFVIKSFPQLGEIKGEEAAKEFIDLMEIENK
jgi:hypothetical protein